MTFPFENDTSAVIRKLANRSIKADKQSNLFLILTIVVSVCMVFSIILISTGSEQMFKDAQRDKAQISIIGASDEQLSLLEQNTHVMWIGEYSLLGFSYQNDITLTLAYGDENYFSNQQGISLQGRVPTGKDEIMLPQNYIDFLGASYGVGDTVSLDLTGTGNKADYTLSGILDIREKSKGYFIYVGEELANKLSGGTMQTTAYTRLDSNLTTSDDILELAYDAIQNTGIENGQVNLTEYFAVMTGVVKSGIPIPLPLLSLLTAVLAAFVVYGIFYTKITKNVQTLGQLRTLGMTKRQIKKMVKREGYQFAVKGIPLGLICGAIIGFVACPAGFKISTTLTYACIIAVVSIIMLSIAIFKPMHVAMNTSPLEGSKYLVYVGKAKSSHKLHRKLTPLNLAAINIGRNKRKAVFVFLMLGLSGALLLATATVAGSIDAEKQARFKYYPDGDLQLRIRNVAQSSFNTDTESYGITKTQLEDNPLEKQELIEQLESISGVERVTPANCIMMTITFPDDMRSITSITDIFPTIDREQTNAKQSMLSAGIADYDDMVEKNGILVADDTANVGDVLTLNGRASDGRTFDVDAVVVGTYNRADLMLENPTVPGSPYFIMTYDTAEKLTGVTAQTGVLSIETAKGNYERVASAIQNIVNENDQLEFHTITQSETSIQKYYNPSIQTFYLISIILLVFGSMSLANTLLVDLGNRRREFGLFKAVGATQKQLNKMLNKEIITYLAGSLIIALVGSSIIGFAVCRRLDAINHCISFSFPWLFLLALITMLALIYFVFSLYSRNGLKKTSILSAIREE